MVGGVARMSDVFISYSHEDRATARRFAAAMEAEGLSVWWDDAMRSGDAFDEKIEQALRGAKAVVVLWSKHSVASRWVRAEAAQADRMRTLAPVMIEACERPIMFELTHTLDLSHWTGDPKNEAWRDFLGRGARVCGASARAAPRGRARPSVRCRDGCAAAAKWPSKRCGDALHQPLRRCRGRRLRRRHG